MAVIDVALEVIDDNPYNPRKHYPQAKVREMARSLFEVGLRQVPEGRHVDGRVELAYGHMRLRGFRYNQKMPREPEKWTTMPVDVKEISDQDMFHFSMEENLTRSDISPLEVARCIDNFFVMFPGTTETEIANKHNMTQGHVANMRRVLRLPDKVLVKIDEGRINFTQGRELITLDKFENSEEMMLTAISSIRTEGRPYGNANTVEGMQKSVHDVASNHCRPIDKQFEGHRYDLLFDTRAAGCLECEKMIRTNPTKSATAHWCLDPECWEKKQQEHRDKAAVVAKAKMEAEILRQAAESVTTEAKETISQEIVGPALPKYTLEKRGTSWIALDAQGVVIAIDTTKEKADAGAVAYFAPVATIVNPGTGEYVLNHTYRISRELNRRKPDDIFDVTAQDLPTAITALGVKMEDIEAVRVYKSSGKLGTGGGVSAGWSKCTEPLEDVQEQLEEKADERDRQTEEARERANLERPVGVLPCDTCLRGGSCDRSFFHVADDDSGRLVCEQWERALPKEPAQVVPEEQIEQDIGRRIAAAPAPQEIPEDILAMARERAGTRAEVLDLNDICIGEGYSRQIKSGYAILDDELRFIDDSAECLERCTKGFHYAFDSKAKEQREIHVCSDTKCMAQKKSAFTRAKNAAGQARKKAEVKAVKEAIAQTVTLDRPRMRLILLAQIDGLHASKTYYYGVESSTKKPEKWLWDKVSAGTPENDRTRATLFKAIDKFTDEDLAKLVVEFMLYYLVDHGDIGSYEIKATEPLQWMGITVELEEAKG